MSYTFMQMLIPVEPDEIQGGGKGHLFFLVNPFHSVIFSHTY